MARYIDVEELTEEIKSLSVMLGGEFVFKKAKESVLRIIDEQPTADVVEVRHGEWKKPADELKCFKDRYVICSECNVMIPIIIELDEYCYCPRCGAKMDRGKEV